MFGAQRNESLKIHTQCSNESEIQKSEKPSSAIYLHKFARESYDSIDLTRKIPKDEEECSYITSSIYSKSQEVEKNEEELEEVKELSPEQKIIFASESYASIDLTRKPPKEEEECSYTTSSIYFDSKIKEEKEVEELSLKQKTLFYSETYGSIDLSRKFPKEEDSLWINYLDHPESEVEKEEIPEEEEELSPEQKILYAPMSYDSIDLTKRKHPRDSGLLEDNTSQCDVQQLTAAPEKPKSEASINKSPKTSDVQPPAKIPRKNRRTDTTFVMQPVKKIEGDTPQRPFPKELYWYNPAVSGTATEIFDMLFKSSSQTKPKYTQANFAAPASALKIIEQARQKAFQTTTGIPKDQQKSQKQRKVLESAQNTLWLVHSYKKDAALEHNLRSTIQKFSCTRGDDGRLRILEKNDLSIVWDLSQREPDWQVKPVFIDGLSIVDMISGSSSTGLPVLQVQILMEILLHFVMNGHQVTLFLPEVYNNNTEKIDDSEVFKFLCTLDVVKFVSKKNRKAVAAEVLMEAEKTAGIICSNSEDLQTTLSIQCFPVLHKLSMNDYTVSTVFAQKDSSRNCRLYPKENTEMDTSTSQLTLERQVYLISSLIHVTTFHGQRKQQIEVFLKMINRFLPEILPEFMQKSMINTVGESIGMLQAEENLESWPIFLK
ncbi:unnamed protein product [Caenorhabditis brenneri]